MKRRRGYLKHFNDATVGDSFQQLLLKKRPYSILLFWFFLERMNQKNSAKILITHDEFRFRFFQKIDKTLKDLSVLCEIVQSVHAVFNQDSVEISIDNYAEYQETRGGKRESNDDPKVSPLKIKDKRLKIKDKRYQIPDNWIDEAYSIFPRKEGRSKGFQKLKETIKNKDHWNSFVSALENYIKKIDAENPETKHIKLFSTFVNSWEDYLPQNYTPPKKNTAPTGIAVIRQFNEK